MHSTDLHDLPAGHVCVDQKPEGVVTRLKAEEAKHTGRSARQGGQKHPDNSSSSSARSTHQAKVTSLTNTPDDSHDTSFNTAQPGLHRLPQSSQTLTGSAMSQWKAPSEPEAMGISTCTSKTGAAAFLSVSVSCSCSGPAQTPADQAASPVRPTALLSPSLVALREWCSEGTAANFIIAAPTNFKHPQCTHCMLPVHICWPHHYQPVSLHHQPVMAALSKTTGNMSCLTRTLQIQQQMTQPAGLVL